MTAPVREVYGRWAGIYESLARAPVVSAWRSAAVGELELVAMDAVVDVGCGTGANLPHLRARVGPDGTVVGLDLTREMLVRADGAGDATLVQGDATRPPLRGDVDGLLATFVVGLFADPVAAVDEWVGLVRPGGRVALLHFCRSDRRWTRPLNPAYRIFVRAASTDTFANGDVAGTHDARVRVAHDALAARTTDYRERRIAGGYVRVASGRVPGE